MVVRRLLVVIQRQNPRQRLAEYLRPADWRRCLRRAEFLRSADWQRCLRRAEFPRSADWRHCRRRADFRPPHPGDCPAWAKLPIDGRLFATWPPLGLLTFEVLGRDIDGVREATLRDPPPPPLDAPPLGRDTATRARHRHRVMPHRRLVIHRRRHRPPPPPPPRPPRAHISLASQTHTAIATITINNFFMAAPFMVKRISLELNL